MGIYNHYVLPRLINFTMQNKLVAAERQKWVPLASGAVLEIGIGSGLNIPFYSRTIERLVGVDPSGALWKMARTRIEIAPFPIDYLELSGECLPVEDATFDTVVTTWTLCTIPDPIKALEEMRRVLKLNGRLIFIEHGLAPEHKVQRWQNHLNPLWKRLAGGCNLNRRIKTLITDAGFHLTQIDTGYLPGPKPPSFLYRGLARPA
jgi:ubiquinone/menaquinone biosynthesis C-methylase UbiE